MEKCEKPIQFNMDISIQIQGRDKARKFNSIKRLIYPPVKKMAKYSGIFLVHLKPPMTRRLSQLWRLNTAAKYVHGEEFLGSWRPRGVSLVTDYVRIQEFIKRKADISFTNQILKLRQLDEPSSHNELSPEDQEIRLKKVIELWTLKLGINQEVGADKTY
jgi:kinesin family protein 1